MPSAPPAASDADPTAELLEALLPILGRIHRERTLSPGKVGILRHLARHGRAGTAELATAVQVSPQAVSLATRELEAMGLVERIPDDGDRRRSWIQATEAGRLALAEETRAGRSWLQVAVREHLSAAERQTLASAIPVLAKLTAEPPSGRSPAGEPESPRG
jgi:DNA-binding MarR family transcriptional regulator